MFSAFETVAREERFHFLPLFLRRVPTSLRALVFLTRIHRRYSICVRSLTREHPPLEPRGRRLTSTSSSGALLSSPINQFPYRRNHGDDGHPRESLRSGSTAATGPYEMRRGGRAEITPLPDHLIPRSATGGNEIAREEHAIANGTLAHPNPGRVHLMSYPVHYHTVS